MGPRGTPVHSEAEGIYSEVDGADCHADWLDQEGVQASRNVARSGGGRQRNEEPQIQRKPGQEKTQQAGTSEGRPK